MHRCRERSLIVTKCFSFSNRRKFRVASRLCIETKARLFSFDEVHVTFISWWKSFDFLWIESDWFISIENVIERDFMLVDHFLISDSSHWRYQLGHSLCCSIEARTLKRAPISLHAASEKNLVLISWTEQNAIFVVVIPIKSNKHHMRPSWYITIHLKRHDSFIWTAHAHDCITEKDLIAKLFLLMSRSWSRQISLALPVCSKLNSSRRSFRLNKRGQMLWSVFDKDKQIVYRLSPRNSSTWMLNGSFFKCIASRWSSTENTSV